MTLIEVELVRRIHIGNISQKLRDTRDMLTTRLSKYGKLQKPLEFHTKAAGDFFFAYADMEINDRGLELLKKTLNGVLYMGRKISIGLAKASYEQKWLKDHGRPSPSAQKLHAKAGIASARDARLKETSTPFPSNSVTGAPVVKTSIIGPNNSSIGYMKSAQMFHDMSGNTKNRMPSHTLNGLKSYGSSLVAKNSFTQQFSRASGYGEVVRGRIRKTARPASYFARKEQTMRLLINGDFKQIKCFKTKLWGVEKNKYARDLTYQFVDGTWKSGDDHVVERSLRSRKQVLANETKCGVSGKQAHKSGPRCISNKEIIGENGKETSAQMDEEKATNAAVLAKLFTTIDFNKRADLEDIDILDENAISYDSMGRKAVPRFDFETQGTSALSESDDDADGEYFKDGTDKMVIIKQFKTSKERPPDEVYSESDEGNDIDMYALQQNYTMETTKIQYDDAYGIEAGENQMYAGGTQLSAEDVVGAASVDANLGNDFVNESLGDGVSLSGKSEREKGANVSKDNSEHRSSERLSGASSESSSSEDGSFDRSSDSSSDRSSDGTSYSSLDSSSDSSSQDSSSDEEEDNTVEEKADSKATVPESDSDCEVGKLMPRISAPRKPTSNTTENLRSLFSQGQDQDASTGFSLAVDKEDIDEEQQLIREQERQKLLEQIKQKQEKEKESQDQKVHTQKRNAGLFWAHLDSPFLQPRTQLSKVGYVGEKFKLPGETSDDDTSLHPLIKGENDAYEKWFWSVRGEIGRECRKRRREVLKKMEKKNVQAYL